MEQWEYRVLTTEAAGWFAGGQIDGPEIQKGLNLCGDQGWELVSAFDTNQGHGASRFYVFLLKRRKVPDHE